ncbi:MAG: alpha/beta hydrolase, partial [Candidatus Caldatribacterium sp.]|nr:alpha/beta hydrolase [Candidatus Caldatribacterium sp.]
MIRSSAILLIFFLLLSYISLENAASILSRELKEQFAFSFFENERIKEELAQTFGLKKVKEGKPLYMPPEILAEYTESIVYKDVPYGNDKAQKLDILVPLSIRRNEKLPVFVFVHGGTWIGGSKNEALYRHFAREVTRAGYIFVSLDYRVYPRVRFSGILADVRKALSFLYENIETYGGRREFVLCGHSAGAHLVALSTVKRGILPEEVYKAVRLVLLLSGPYDLPAYEETLDIPFRNLIRRIFFDLFEGKKNLRELSPVFQVEKTPIPFVLVVGEEDEITPKEQSMRLFEELRAKGNSAELFILPGVGHGGTLYVLNSEFDRKGLFTPT